MAAETKPSAAAQHAAVAAARKRIKEAPPAPPDGLGNGWRLQNMGVTTVDGIPPGDVFDISHWSKTKLDRVVTAPGHEHMVVLKPSDKAVSFEEPKVG